MTEREIRSREVGADARWSTTMVNRRDMIKGSALAAAAGATLTAGDAAAQTGRQWERSYSGGSVDTPAAPPIAASGYRPTETPNGGSLPFRIVDGVKVFHLIAGEVEHEFADGLRAHCWGYNGRVNSTTIEAVEGERVRIYVTNRLPVPTTVHWHGLYLPNGMDGVSGLTQRPIAPGETFKYEYTLRQYGTYMFHSHHDVMAQEGMGLIGMFVIHPRSPSPDQRVVRDFTIMLTVQAPLAEPVAPRGPAAEGASTVNAASANGFLGSMPITETRR